MPIIPLSKILEDRDDALSGGGTIVKSVKCFSTPDRDDDIYPADIGMPLSYSCIFKQEFIPDSVTGVGNRVQFEDMDSAGNHISDGETAEETPVLSDELFEELLDNSNEMYHMKREELPLELSNIPIRRRRISERDTVPVPETSTSSRAPRRTKKFIPKDSILMAKKRFTRNRKRNRDKNK